jgi:hypothetical protein
MSWALSVDVLRGWNDVEPNRRAKARNRSALGFIRRRSVLIFYHVALLMIYSVAATIHSWAGSL